MRRQVLIKYLPLVLIFVVANCRPQTKTERGPAEVVYQVDISNPSDDLFHITVLAKNLDDDNGIYQFAATAPGTYSILDFGRFVTSFKAFDADGNEIPVERLSTNRWKIADPERLYVLRYQIEDTFDARVTENPVAPMSGSGLDTTFAGFNTFSVLGYFEGLQTHPVRMKVLTRPNWKIGTALPTADGYYVASTYDHLADSPVLAGELSVAQTTVNDIDVELYVFAVDTSVSATRILTMADDVLQSAGEFIGYSPVPSYKFLMVLLDGPTFQRYGLMGAGALEHSYSSFYVLPSSPGALAELQSIMAHEFMHILTPLNLHSEVIHSYNFAEPTPSEHLWLYEGVTEWVSDIMQLRSGLIDTKEFLRQFSLKLTTDQGYDSTMSLSEMAMKVYNPEGGRQFGNIYSRGAVVAALLDIRLLELSNGTRGLREVFLDLLSRYGPSKPFPEKRFFDVLVDATYPEIRQFVDDYIRGSRPLPYREYMAKLGFRYVGERPSEDQRPVIGIGLEGNPDGIAISSVDSRARAFGFKEGDVIVRLFGEELTMQTAGKVFDKLSGMKIGDPYEVVVRRDGRELALRGNLLARMTRHVFDEMETLTDTQRFLRERWSRHQ